MPIDRITWKRGFDREEVPPWLCPRCGHATLQLEQRPYLDRGVQKSEPVFVEKETVDSRNDPEGCDESYSGVFGTVLQCSRSDCKCVVSVCGETEQCECISTMGDSYFTTYFKPRYFWPPVLIFLIPAQCPSQIRQEIEAAFSLYWADPSACVNRLRTAIELLCEDAARHHQCDAINSGRVEGDASCN